MINQFTWLDIYLIGMVLTFALALIVNQCRKPEHKDEFHILVMASVIWPIPVLIAFVEACFIWAMRR